MAVWVSLIFGFTYVGLIVCGHPRSPLARWQVALLGAFCVLAIQAISLSQAWQSISWDIIGILFGLMVISGYMHQAGILDALAKKIITRMRHQRQVLLALIIIAAVGSAFLTNDVVCLILAPMVITLCQRYEMAPMPFLLGVALASNAGSVATLSGNPQNIIIGVYSGIPYARFFLTMAPLACVSVLVNYFLLRIIFRQSLAMPIKVVDEISKPVESARAEIGIFAIVVVLFFSPLPMWLPALVGAVVLLCYRNRKPDFWRTINLPLLLLFVGFFVLVDAMDKQVVHNWHIDDWPGIQSDPGAFVAVFAPVFSNIFSNVPLTLLFKSLIQYFDNPEYIWLMLSASCTLAGNATLFGSFANMIVAEQARPYGIQMGYLTFLRVGVLSAIITIVCAYLYLTYVVVTFQ
ncbi:putative transporter [BD1-7 clade bacterium]|uniref:Putative transporter n=1 Tax=BD1-7 clade bacterium TaxID=2029982 RepID=A0A5S9QW00_9GAMM|nr:putative transporter [BD1-7 clade bacterium]